MNSDQYSQYTQSKSLNIYFYASVIIVPIGILLNLKSFLLFHEDRVKNQISFQYRTVIIFKVVTFFWSIVIYRYLPLSGINLDTYSQITCALFTYISRVLQQIPFYILTYLAYLNYLSVIHSPNFKRLNKNSNFVLSVILIIFILLIFNIPSSINHIKVYNNTYYNTSIVKCVSYSNTISAIGLFVTSFIRFFFPFIVVNIYNFKSLNYLISIKKSNNASLDDEKKLAFTFIFFDILSAVFNLPLACLQIILGVNQYELNYSIDTLNESNISIIYEITRILAWSYYFFPNLLAFFFNKIERDSLIAVFKKIINITTIKS